MYYVEESHPAIIDKEMHTAVQLEMERRRAFAEKYNISKLDYATVNNPSLVDVGILKFYNNKVYNLGYQLISYDDLYLLMDGRINYSSKGIHDIYIGTDSYLMLYYINTQNLYKNFIVMDLCT